MTLLSTLENDQSSYLVLFLVLSFSFLGLFLFITSLLPSLSIFHYHSSHHICIYSHLFLSITSLFLFFPLLSITSTPSLYPFYFYSASSLYFTSSVSRLIIFYLLTGLLFFNPFLHFTLHLISPSVHHDFFFLTYLYCWDGHDQNVSFGPVYHALQFCL